MLSIAGPSIPQLLILFAFIISMIWSVPLMLPGIGSDPPAEGDYGDPESPHEAATGPASQGGQEAEREIKAAPSGCWKWRLWWGAGNGEEHYKVFFLLTLKMCSNVCDEKHTVLSKKLKSTINTIACCCVYRQAVFVCQCWGFTEGPVLLEIVISSVETT